MLSTGRYYSKENLFEGDIMLTKEQQFSIFHGTTLFSAIEGGNWPDGIIPYVFARGYPNSMRKKVLKGMKAFLRPTCIQFKPRTTSDKYYIYIEDDGTCSSYVGRIIDECCPDNHVKYNGQSVGLAGGCMRHGT